MIRPIGVDLFAGVGGLSLGFEQAGFDIVAAIEIDPIHAAVHKYNFPRCAVIAKSVTELSGASIRQQAGLRRKRIDVVFGGAPCQGFSLMGQRALSDPRNRLVREFVRLVAELEPAYFVFENVKGLTIGKHRVFLDEVIDAFDEIGYNTRLPWQVLNAAHFGVPQHRERLILIGARKGHKLPGYPAPIVSPADGGMAIASLAFGPTCKDALHDLPEAEDFDELLYKDDVTTDKWGEPSEYAKEMRASDIVHWHLGYLRRFECKSFTSSLRTDHTQISRRRFSDTKPGTVEPISRFYKLPPHGLSNTLRAGTDSARGAFTSPRPIHYDRPRCVTVREMARLHGFPDWFRFHATKWHGARQIGNAVPPPFARAIAEQIVATIAHKIAKPDYAIELGDPYLLTLDMSAAASMFGVPVAIGKRDRKSGARKRKQEEIEAAERMGELQIA